MLLASGARDTSVCVWNLEQRRCALRIAGHRAPVSGVAFVDDSTLVSSSLDRTLRVVDLSAGGRTTRTLTEHDGVVTGVVSLDPSSQTVASCSADSSLRVWDLRVPIPCVHVLFDHDAAVYGLIAMRHDPLTLVSASWDRTVKVWSLRMPPPKGDANDGGRCVRTLRGHTDAVRALVQLDDSHVASAGWDCTVRLWDLEQSELEPAAAADAAVPIDSSIGVIKGHSAWIYTLCYLPEQQLLVSGSGDRTIRLSSPATMQCASVLTGHENTIWNVAALPWGTASAASSAIAAESSSSSASSASATSARPSGQFVSAGADAQIRVWDTVGKSCTRISGGHAPDASVHALDVWPSLRDDPAARRPLRLAMRDGKDQSGCSGSSNSSSSTAPDPAAAADPRGAEAEFAAALAEQTRQSLSLSAPSASGAVPAASSSDSSLAPATATPAVATAAAAVPSEPAPTRPGLYADELERHGGRELLTQIEHEVHSKPADNLAHSALGRAAHTTFAVASCGFNEPKSAVEDAAASAAGAAAAAATSAASDASSAPSVAPAPSGPCTPSPAGTSASRPSSSSSSSSSFLAELAALRDDAVRHYDSQSLVRAEQTLLEMVALVEQQQEQSTSPGAAIAPQLQQQQSPLSQAALTSTLFYLYHDLSVVAFAQGAHAAAMRYATRCLAFYEGDDDDEDEEEDDDVENGAPSKGPSVAAQRQHLLLEERRGPDEEIPDMIPAQLALRHWCLDGTAPAPPASAIVAGKAVVPRASSLILSLQLRRFWGAYSSREVELSQQLCGGLLSLLEANHLRREVCLDEIEEALLGHGHGQGGGSEAPALELPLRSLYAQLLRVYHEEVLVAFVQRKMGLIARCKERGNAFFAGSAPPPDHAASKSNANTSGSGNDSGGDSESGSGCVPQYGCALTEYSRALALADALDDTLRDGSSCPSAMWFEIAAAQVPTLRGAHAQHAAAGSFLLDQAVVPAFSAHHLAFLRATLHANLAMAALKCSDDAYAGEGLPVPSIVPPAAQNRARRQGVTLLTGAVPPEQVRLLAAQRACEEGIEAMEALCAGLKNLRESVARAKSSLSTRAPARTRAPDDHDDNDDSEGAGERNVYAESPGLFASLPSLSQCASLQSKLYYRHGLAARERSRRVAAGTGSAGSTGETTAETGASLDALARASFALSSQLQPQEKVKREIERKGKDGKMAESKAAPAPAPAPAPAAPVPVSAPAPASAALPAISTTIAASASPVPAASAPSAVAPTLMTPVSQPD